MKKLQKAVLLLALTLIASCSKDDPKTPVTATVIDYSTAAAISGEFQRNVLIEDYTGTWCGYCPRMAYGIEKVIEQGIRIVPVAIHGGSSTEPFLYSGTFPTTVTGYPTGKLNRGADWDYLSTSDITKVKRLNGNNCPMGIAMNSTVTGTTINLDVKTKYTADYSGLKLVVYVVEDGLVYTQQNYTSYYGGGSTIPGFVHNNALRACFTDVLGDALTGTVKGATVTKNFSVNIPSRVQNVANMKFIAFLVDAAGQTINVRSSASGVNQAFEENL